MPLSFLGISLGSGSWGRCVSRSRLVSRCWVVRFGLRVDGSSFVCDVSNITVIVISGVGNSLDTTIGKGN